MAIKGSKKKNLNWEDAGIIAPAGKVFEKLENSGIDINKVVTLKVTDLIPHQHHTYQVRENANLEELIASIKENGIITPLLVRKLDDKFEIISGHRRFFAATKIGLEKVPAIVLDIDDNLSDIYMNQANTYRNDILPSERANGYRVEYEARKKMDPKLPAVKIYAEMADDAMDSVATIKRYLRLSTLIPPLLEMVDSGTVMTSKQGLILSKLPADVQKLVSEVITENGEKISEKQAESIVATYEKNPELDKDAVKTAITNLFAPRSRKSKEKKITEKTLKAFLPESLAKIPADKRIMLYEDALKMYAKYLLENPAEISKYL